MLFLTLNASEKADQGLFFWLSVICLAAAIVMIFCLGCAYRMYISEEARLAEAAAKLDHQEIEMEE